MSFLDLKVILEGGFPSLLLPLDVAEDLNGFGSLERRHRDFRNMLMSLVFQVGLTGEDHLQGAIGARQKDLSDLSIRVMQGLVGFVTVYRDFSKIVATLLVE